MCLLHATLRARNFACRCKERTTAWSNKARETELNLGQYIYEMIVLNIPQKRYHPDYLSGKLAAPKASSSPEPTEQTVDPRWEKLKDIKS